MTKYLTSRLLIVFLIKFFTGWAFNLDGQFAQFFDFEMTDNFFLKCLSWLLTVAVIGLGVISVNLIYTFFRLTDNYSYSELIQAVGDKGIKNSIKLFFHNFSGLFSANLNNEFRLERYPILFLLFIFLFLPFINGNPFLNNYYGVYKEYEIEDQGRYGERTDYIEKQNYIFHKSNGNEMNSRMNNLEQDYDEDEPYYEVKKRGYLFVQAGLIDGFNTYYKEYKGIGSYIECLFFSALEKLINSIIYFLIPFLIGISIYHYKNREATTEKIKNNRSWE